MLRAYLHCTPHLLYAPCPFFHTEDQLTDQEVKSLKLLKSGDLRRSANAAIAAFGHGTLRRADGVKAEIGGSTGGITRCLLDGYEETDVADFLEDNCFVDTQ